MYLQDFPVLKINFGQKTLCINFPIINRCVPLHRKSEVKHFYRLLEDPVLLRILG